MDEKRLRYGERETMIYLMNLVSSMAYAKDDIKERLTMIPEGSERMQKTLDMFSELLSDLLLTIPVNQCIGLKHTSEDYSLRAVPKITPKPTNVLMTRDEAKTLIDCAREGRCSSCVMDGNECRKCKLEQAFESITPLKDYGMALCPYNLAEWEE